VNKTNPVQEFIFEYLKKKCRYSDKQIAEKIGITVSNYNQIKNGHVMPNILTFSRMCVEFNLSQTKIFELISYLSEMHRHRVVVERGSPLKYKKKEKI